MKTLNTIQTISRIGKIISKIVFILSLVGGIGCIVGILCLALIPEGLKLGGVTIQGLIENEAALSSGAVYAAMAVGAILCAGEAVLSKLANNYFTHELAAGTPFTFDGAKEMIRLGICTIAIPIGTAVVAGIVYGILNAIFHSSPELDLSNSFSVGLGVMFIITGLICRHGAEVVQMNGIPQPTVIDSTETEQGE